MSSDFVIFGACRCTVWPLVPSMNYGKCGKCGERPGIQSVSHDRVAEMFRDEYGEEPHDPRPREGETCSP